LIVSGFFTSPLDHSRIFSGLANEMRMAEKESGSFGFSKKEKISRMVFP
jgi:ribosomal protein S7